MTQPPTMPDNGVGVDANVVIDELVAHIGRLSRENAILRAQVKTYTGTDHQVSATQDK